MRIAIYFSRPRSNPNWLLRLARTVRALRRLWNDYRFFRGQLNHSHRSAWEKAQRTVG